MENIKEKLSEIIEQAGCDTKKCQYCKSYKNGGCSYGCLNERVRLTSPNYYCDHFDANYALNENTLDNLKDLLRQLKELMKVQRTLNSSLLGKLQKMNLMIW